jgi:hypothetical protein
MTPQSEPPKEKPPEDEERVPRDHFLYIDPETRRKVDARTNAGIAVERQQRAARALRRQTQQ